MLSKREQHQDMYKPDEMRGSVYRGGKFWGKGHDTPEENSKMTCAGEDS